jgi:hypothetical protein
VIPIVEQALHLDLYSNAGERLRCHLNAVERSVHMLARLTLRFLQHFCCSGVNSCDRLWAALCCLLIYDLVASHAFETARNSWDLRSALMDRALTHAVSVLCS